MQVTHTAVRQGEEGYCWHRQDQEKADAKVMVGSSLLLLIHHDLSHDDVLDDAFSTNIVPHLTTPNPSRK